MEIQGTKEIEIRSQALPMLASVSWNPSQDTDDLLLAWFKVFYKLELYLRLGLASEKVREAILYFCKRYNIYTTEKVGEVSRIIRECFTDNLREGEIQKRIREKLILKDVQAKEAFFDIKEILFLVKREGTNELDMERILVDFKEALKKSEVVGEQEIGSFLIKLDILGDVARPSIKNWIEDYIEQKGISQHTAMQRSDYLFNSRNAKKLNSEDREKLALILRAFDENSKVYLIKKEGTILFQVPRQEQPAFEKSASAKLSNAQPLPSREQKSPQNQKTFFTEQRSSASEQTQKQDFFAPDMKIKAFTQGNETTLVNLAKSDPAKTSFSSNKTISQPAVPPSNKNPNQARSGAFSDSYFTPKAVNQTEKKNNKNSNINVLDLKDYL